MTEPQSALGEPLFATPMEDLVRSAKAGDLIPAARGEDPILENGDDTGIPEQEEFFRSPARFGSIPVDQAPLGWDRRQKFNKLYPFVSLPTQVVDRVSFGNPGLPPNRLFWGDNLHVMRQLPSESVDLIYIDPPFFSGRNYNVIFGDQNEIRSFGDIWESGMPGYLEWLNARLFEMKRLLKSHGSLMVHVDWHASHYVKVELDKIFGHGNLQTEVIWRYRRWPAKTRNLQRMHDSLLYYVKTRDGGHRFHQLYEALAPSTQQTWGTKRQVADFSSGHRKPSQTDEESKGSPLSDVWDIGVIAPIAKERIGYPTQKPEALIERVLNVASDPGDVVADFFIGGGTTAAVAQRLGRRWIACDQSRVAVAVTADRLAKQAEQAELVMTGGGRRFHNRTLGHLRSRPPVPGAARSIPALRHGRRPTAPRAGRVADPRVSRAASRLDRAARP